MTVFRSIRRRTNSWSILSILFTLLILSPALSIFVQIFEKPNENWAHIQEFLLKNYIQNTLTIVLFTGIFSILIGVSLAWLVTAYTFPLRRFFKWGLILPLAIPPYIGGYTYHGIVNYTGIVQSTLRNEFGIHANPVFFDILNIPGAIFVFTIFLYPYVYIITRAYLEQQSASLIENARLLGSGPLELFFRVIIPISRTAIIGGASLVILEVLNDYGVVSYFGIQVFTTAIFQAWFGMGDVGTAIKLAGILMSLVFLILFFEKALRGRKQYSYSNAKVRPLEPVSLSRKKTTVLFAYVTVIFMLGFAIPFVQLFQWMLLTYEKVMSPEFTQLIANSVYVSMVSAFIIMAVALVIGNFTRLSDGILSKAISRVTVLGYSIPGAVIAIGVLTFFLWLDRRLNVLYEWLNIDAPIILSLSLIMLIFAYVSRFLAIGFNPVDAGFDKIGRSFTEASRLLGKPLWRTFIQVDLPMIRSAVLGGYTLVFIEVMKELPLTLLLQPFNFYTLSTKAFQYANDEAVHEAALASILIIFISGLSIFMFHAVLEKEKR
ncbi:ABC transporter permease [Domibacillus enclensis]|uniref:Iron ABC transporter n=1 Tax=Domibacillus enclensis TaxID=1017273 RepID=A0A1N6U8H0_9BACI|nr:iron ABC transporter permease [Domibacillus enclensis]OXS78462.1 iron ABC transporter [Domibacillus enclensis]SIQ61922.1 iron(III) transport system permease protein [Domibacillus enclensis]